MGDVRRPFLVPQPPPPASLPCSMWPLEGAHLSEGRAPASPSRGGTQSLGTTPVVTRPARIWHTRGQALS